MANLNEEKKIKLGDIITETFRIDDGKHEGRITEAFFYTDEQIMIKIETLDNETFLYPVTADRICRYPFSVFRSEANIHYIEDFIGLFVKFETKNKSEDSEFSNIKKIHLLK